MNFHLNYKKRKLKSKFGLTFNDYLYLSPTLKIGAHTYGGSYINVIHAGDSAMVTVGKFCSIANNINIILGGNHRTDWVSTYPFGHLNADFGNFGEAVRGVMPKPKNVIIGNDVWIGSGVTIMGGVTVGDGAIIAANSHVIKNIAPYTIYGGNPAQKIKDRFESKIIDDLLQIQWWNYDIKSIKKIIPYLTCIPTQDSISQLKRELRIKQ
jgi:acetyltransferase-like isoleucine patch superfamily enzyme